MTVQLLADPVDSVVVMRMTGASYPQIAAALGVSPRVARMRVKRAVARGLVTAQQARYRPQERRPFIEDTEYDRRWLERLRARTVMAENGCFVWQGPTGPKGYIIQHHRRWRNSGHRVAYRLLKRADLTTDELVCHSCDTPRCWNPDHLWIGAPAANSMDMVQKGRCHEWTVTHCPRGHEYNEENTRWKTAVSGRPARLCRVCERARLASPAYRKKANERQQRLRAKAKAQKLGVSL